MRQNKPQQPQQRLQVGDVVRESHDTGVGVVLALVRDHDHDQDFAVVHLIGENERLFGGYREDLVPTGFQVANVAAPAPMGKDSNGRRICVGDFVTEPHADDGAGIVKAVHGNLVVFQNDADGWLTYQYAGSLRSAARRQGAHASDRRSASSAKRLGAMALV